GPAGDRLEAAVEREADLAGRVRERVEPGQLVRPLNQAAGLGHRGSLAFGERALVRLAALAGSKAGLFGRRRRSVERDVLAAGKAGGAGRPAIGARRAPPTT